MAALVVVIAASLPAAAFETRARAAWVFDHKTRTVLMAKNADVPLPPASMSKLMTLDLLFEALEDGRVTLDTTFRVSAAAQAMGGSKMFLREGERVAVRDLIPGIIVHSGNDACVTVAEGLAGTEEAFVAIMNERARALGLRHAHFANASGWPHPEHRMSAEDLGRLAVRMVEEFPDLYPHFSQREFTWAGITQRNRNPLLGLGIGADGLKTGHTEEAGYGLVGSAVRGDRRVTFVLMGLPDVRARAEESERILNWAFHQFAVKTVARAGERLATAPVWIGEVPTVGLVLADDLSVLVPASQKDAIEARIVYDAPVEAPVAKGQRIGELVMSIASIGEVRRPLVAEAAVPRGGLVPRLRASAMTLARRAMDGTLFGAE
ncbi:MAG: D-alanyl-D-alanine carboxypeptidase [Alphaproteobacteria bacterium]|nr:MAG: D-alanyl-D-alanine carboxypeptidase [Alphaproteobacteria bacterium]